MTISTCFDQSGKYFASVISKNGRNEVQIFTIGDSMSSTSESVVKHELEQSAKVKSVCWAYEDEKKVASKKRKAADESISSNGSRATKSYFVVSLEGGELYVFNPIGSSPKSYASSGLIAPSWKNNASVWSVQENTIHEVSVVSGKLTKSLKVEEEKSYRLVHSVENELLLVLLAGEAGSLYLVDASKTTKKCLISKFIGSSSDIQSIDQSKVNSEVFAIVRESDPMVYLYSINGGEEPVGKLNVESDEVDAVKFVSSNDEDEEEYLFAFTKEGIKVFDVTSNAQVGQITVSGSIFKDISKLEDGRLVGVWYDKNEPRFEIIHKVAGQVVIGEEAEEEDDDEEVEDIEANSDTDNEYDEELLLARKKQVTKNISADELYSKLSKLLNNHTSNKEKIVELCSQNDNENNIKQSLKLFSTDLENSQLIKNFFDVVSKEVSQHPTRTKPLSIWLKWSLLTHGGYIANQADQKDNLKNLQKGLSNGMKLMPKLLSLQGRLNLLKSQMELRNRISSNESLEYDEEADITEEGNTVNETTMNGEDTIIYANGETDDFVLNGEEDDEDEVVEGEVEEEDEDDNVEEEE